MGTFVARRLVRALLVCLGISLITFALLHVVGNPVLLLLPQSASDEDVRLLKEKLGLDRPLWAQYAVFLGGALRGDFGQSLFTQESALALIWERMPATLELTFAGMLVGLAIAIPLGVVSAIRRGSLTDRLCTVGAVAGQAMPIFWLGIMLIILFAVIWRVLPASGRGTPAHLILPAITLGAYLAPLTMRLTRSGMLDVLTQDYIRTARAKGVGERVLLFKHALRNAAIPIVTILGVQFGRLLGGAVVTETVFAWPGVASLAVKAIRTYDYPVVQGAVVLLALLIVLANLLTDIAVTWLDPRIRLEDRGA
ncbi:MAG: ABC transporter permease [Candidatus Rokubacteria bacterium]|nr:ABC transporter permease [Candidatus Rokubacteria bacterium]MBI2013969.1 ABC transporter permease [Candidatus Rokubacteria bacterium]MBI4628214.1 ABC transporter permease [Candidatus Rokubacteria bacterium]